MKFFFLPLFFLLMFSLGATPVIPDPVAEFRGKPIPRSVLTDDLKTLTGLSPQDHTGFRIALRRAVEKHCGETVLAEILSRPVPETPRAMAERYISEQNLGDEVRNKLREELDDPDFQRKAKIHYILQERYGAEALEITGEELRIYYHSHPEKFRLPENLLLGIISFADEKSAREAREKLMQGANFDRIAREYDPQGERHTPTEEEGAALREIADKLNVNDLSEIIRYGERFFIIKLNAKEASRMRPFAEVHDALKMELLGLREAALLQKLLSDEIDRGNLVVYDADLR